MGTAAADPDPDPETMAAVSAGAEVPAAITLLLVACFAVAVVLVDPPPVDTVDVAATLATFAALDVSDDVVTVAPIVGGRLEAKTGDGSICCTKFDGKTPTLLRRRPRHQPSST